MSKMTSYERCSAVLYEETPDRVPVYGMEGSVVATLGGYKLKDTRFNPELCVKIQEDYMKRSGVDFYYGPLSEANGPFMDLGSEYVSQPEDNWMACIKPYWETPEDIESKELYDPTNPKESKYLRLTYLDKLKLGYQNKGDYLYIGDTWAPFTAVSSIRGVEQLLIDTMLEPELANKAINKGAAHFMEIYNIMLNNGLDWCQISDPTASGTIISDDTFREFVTPSNVKVFDLFRSHNVPIMLHICGDSTSLVNPVKELDPDVFSIDYQIDVGYARNAFGDNFNLAGNIDPVSKLWKGTPDDVRRASKTCIEKAYESGHFILASACDMAKDTPIENIRAMVDAAEKYGRYS